MPYARNISLVMKTSAVMIAAGGERQVYQSVNDVPATLRKALLDSTSGANSQTILIADRRGKEEIARALERVSEPAMAPPENSGARILGLSWRNWIGVGAISFACGVIAWLVCSYRW